MSTELQLAQRSGLRAPEHDAATLAECRAILERNSKSFALAAKLLPSTARDRAAALYAYCRRVDDAIDDCVASEQEAALARLERELSAIYAGGPLRDAEQRAFRVVVSQCAVPQRYPQELIAGMAMDVRNTRYETLDDLLLYCHRVAAVVGLMMCHVLGITRENALEPAAHLGIAMQLTNICRDVAEDYGLGRVYLPRAMLRAAGAAELSHPVRAPLPEDADTRLAMRRVIAQLLSEADRYYASAERGIDALPFRAALAVRAARRLYHAIGIEVRARDCDPGRGRAVVPTRRKLWLVMRMLAGQALSLPRYVWTRLRHRPRARAPRRELNFPEDVLR